jgi:CubicO group peptidase (beta-lactamase class C family)
MSSLCIYAASMTSKLSKNTTSMIADFSLKNKFSGAIAVANPNEILFENYYGLANREQRYKIDQKTVFRIGSITKEFTATIILILDQMGKLDINDPVSKYLPAPKAWKSIKVRHLLEHSSGIENQATYKNYRITSFKDAPEKSILSWLESIEILRSPEKGFGYSNAGYNILACIIERLNHQKYADVLKKLIFKPLSMGGASVTFVPLKNYKKAKGYSSKGEHIEFDMSTYVGAGEITMTLDDFQKWAIGITTPGKLLNDPKLLFQKRIQRHDQYYGYGFMVENQNGFSVAGHNGHTPGFVSTHFFSLKNKTHVVILTNNELFAGPSRKLDKLAWNIIGAVDGYGSILRLLKYSK